jgi:hypothetical protein
MFPQVALVTPLFNMWRSLGLFNTWMGLIIPYLTFSLPLARYTPSAFFREVPREIEQAAAIDGATQFQTFRQVIVPLTASAVFTTAILVFMFCWNDFLFSFPLTSPTAARTVPATLAFFTGASQFQHPYGDDRRCRCCGDRAGCCPGRAFPTQDRLRPSLWRGEGLCAKCARTAVVPHAGRAGHQWPGCGAAAPWP